MTSTPRQELTLQEFLLTFVLGPPGSFPAGLLPEEELRAAIAEHSDRTMTVASQLRIESITRCKTCTKEATRPCLALRILAMPYAGHPAFRPDWAVPESALTVFRD